MGQTAKQPKETTRQSLRRPERRGLHREQPGGEPGQSRETNCFPWKRKDLEIDQSYLITDRQKRQATNICCYSCSRLQAPSCRRCPCGARPRWTACILNALDGIARRRRYKCTRLSPDRTVSYLAVGPLALRYPVFENKVGLPKKKVPPVGRRRRSCGIGCATAAAAPASKAKKVCIY